MLEYSDVMLDKISHSLTPTHEPMKDPIYEYFDTYETKLFPVQGHVATAIAKRLQRQKAVILQGEMSTGKSKNDDSYRGCLFQDERKKRVPRSIDGSPKLNR